MDATKTEREVRQSNGRFANGHCGGPGRPRRLIEREYLAAMSDVVTVDLWRSIVERAVKDALAGDAVARKWLSSYLVGAGVDLLGIAANDARGMTPDDEIRQEADEKGQPIGRRARWRSSTKI